MKLSELLRTIRIESGTAECVVDDSWTQGRSVFGGLQAAIVLAAMRDRVPDDLPLRSLQMSFVAPVAAGPVRATAQLLRSGRSATQVEGCLVEGDARLAPAVAVFGSARESVVAHAPQRPDVARGAARRFPYIDGKTPAFTAHFAATWLEGGMPFTGATSRRTVVELDLRDDGPMSEAHLLALADFIPPVALSLLNRAAPGSSMTWMLENFLSRFDDLPLAGWRVDSEMVAAQDGYTSQSNRLWAPDGRLAALSRQSMVVFG